MALLTIATAARLCGCPRSTLQRAIRAGRLHLDADHRLDTDELTRAGYLTAAAAQQPHAPVAQQPRQGLEDLLRDMQRTMERLADTIEVLSQELRHMQQERSSSVAAAAPVAHQERGMERDMERQSDTALARIRTLRDQGYSLGKIATQLDAEGVPTKRGRPWNRSTVNAILQREGR
jgi:hypothetical protein